MQRRHYGVGRNHGGSHRHGVGSSGVGNSFHSGKYFRMAGGRGLLPDKGYRVFQSGANAAISGDMLTTSGISIDTDKAMLEELGYKVALWND